MEEVKEKEDNVVEEVKEEKREFTFESLLDNIEENEDKRNIVFQYRVENNYGIKAGDGATFENVQFKTEKRNLPHLNDNNILEKEKDFLEWITENNETYSMALLLSVAVFNGFSVSWIVESANDIYNEFDAGEKAEVRSAMSFILKQFGAEIHQTQISTYTGPTEIEVIRLTKEDDSTKILKTIWRECPHLQDKLISWLKKQNAKKTVALAKKAVKVMGEIASWDYYYFIKHIVPMISTDEYILTDMLVAQVAIAVSQCGSYADNINKLMEQWNKSKRVHYILTNLWICTGLEKKTDIMENAIDCFVNRAMEGIQRECENEYLKNLYDFFASGVRSYTFYHILIDKMYQILAACTSIAEKRNVCRLFVRLFAIDISLSRTNKEAPVFIILGIDESEVKDKIISLWQLFWKCNCYRDTFYKLLARFDKYNQPNTYCLECFLNSVLGDICSDEVLEDICIKVRRR